MPHRFKIARVTFIATLFACVSAAFGQPTLSAPANGAVNQPLSVTVSWNAVGAAATYALQVAVTSDFSAPLLNQGGLAATSELLTGLSRSVTYYWRVNATQGVGPTTAWSNAWSFSTIPVAPGVPSLSSPSNNSTNQPVSLTLGWVAVSGATSYTVQVSSSSAFLNFVFGQAGLTALSQSISGLAGNATYYWRVDAVNGGGTSAWSSVWSFVTMLVAPAAPILSAPSNNSVNLPASLTFSWSVVSGATYYYFRLTSSTDFSSTGQFDSYVLSPPYAVSGLSNNTVYRWAVMAYNTAGNSSWSGIWSFATISGLPSTPALVSPLNSSSFATLTPTLTWSLVIGAASYGLQVAKTPDFSTTVLSQTTLAVNSQMVNLQSSGGGIYYWRVSATNSGGSSSWSSAWLFAAGVVPVLSAERGAAGAFARMDNGVLTYEIPGPQTVGISLYTMNGRQIVSFNRLQAAGSYRLPLKNYLLAEGRYILHFKAGSLDRRMTVSLPSR